MITLITGVPGAGKTLYCISKLLRELVGSKIKHGDPEVEVERRILTNINGLLLPHEKIEGGAAWSLGKGGDMIQGEGNRQGLNNWHDWCKPGDVICFDEVQKIWPLQASGSKVAPCIEALETHRHMGVDFIVLTQHPMLVNANLMRLVGRHLHVRRMGNMGLAIVYEWDSASRTLLYKNALAKSPFRYSKDVFKLYKSAEVHTKQKRSTPTLLYLALAAVLGAAYLGPTAYGRISERISPEQTMVAKQAALQGGHSVPAVSPKAAGPVGPAPYRDGHSARAQAPASPAGCASLGDLCKCMDGQGRVLEVEAGYCVSQTQRGPVFDLGADTPSPAAAVAVGDFETLAWLAQRRASGIAQR